MTKLEEKLKELGYELENNYAYVKRLKGNNLLCIYIISNGEIVGLVKGNECYMWQLHIDNLQQAFNQLQQDLAMLKECEE